MTGNSFNHDAERATRAAVATTYGAFLRRLTRRLGNADDAADVLQDFYLRVLSRAGDLREVDKMRRWMGRILETTLIDHYRRQSRQRRLAAEYRHVETLRATAAQDRTTAACRCLYKLLPSLKPDYAELLWRADVAQQPRAHIAAGLRMAENTLRVRLHRARQALKKRLEQTCGTCPADGFLACACGPGQIDAKTG